MLKAATTLLATATLLSACQIPRELEVSEKSVTFCDINNEQRQLDGKMVRTKARYFSTGHGVTLFDPACLGVMIQPDVSRLADGPYEALMKAISEAPPRSPPVSVLEIDLSGTYRAHKRPLAGTLVVENIWSVRPFADGLTACGWLCP